MIFIPLFLLAEDTEEAARALTDFADRLRHNTFSSNGTLIDGTIELDWDIEEVETTSVHLAMRGYIKGMQEF